MDRRNPVESKWTSSSSSQQTRNTRSKGYSSYRSNGGNYDEGYDTNYYNGRSKNESSNYPKRHNYNSYHNDDDYSNNGTGSNSNKSSGPRWRNDSYKQGGHYNNNSNSNSNNSNDGNGKYHHYARGYEERGNEDSFPMNTRSPAPQEKNKGLNEQDNARSVDSVEQPSVQPPELNKHELTRERVEENLSIEPSSRGTQSIANAFSTTGQTSLGLLRSNAASAAETNDSLNYATVGMQQMSINDSNENPTSHTSREEKSSAENHVVDMSAVNYLNTLIYGHTQPGCNLQEMLFSELVGKEADHFAVGDPHAAAQAGLRSSIPHQNNNLLNLFSELISTEAEDKPPTFSTTPGWSLTDAVIGLPDGRAVGVDVITAVAPTDSWKEAAARSLTESDASAPAPPAAPAPAKHRDAATNEGVGEAEHHSAHAHPPRAFRASLEAPEVTRQSLVCVFRDTPQSAERKETCEKNHYQPSALCNEPSWPPANEAEVEKLLKSRNATKLLRHLTIASFSRQHIKGVQELFKTWARNGIPAPDMAFAAYYFYVKEKSERYLCMKHNGRGATPGHGYGKCDFESRRPNSTCRYEHVCLFCRSKEHGWFEEGMCEGYQHLLSEMEELGISEEDLTTLMNAMEKTSVWSH